MGGVGGECGPHSIFASQKKTNALIPLEFLELENQIWAIQKPEL